MEIGNVKLIDIDQEMRGAYLDYAMSVITARALPDVRDGLKPVQRRILYAMGEMGVRHNTPYRKCARIVGDVLGRYHPHGDSAVYEALVRMAQDFSMRHPLVDGQGNFGSVDGDPPAAMRYTECRLTAVAEEMLLDIDKDTVDFSENFDATLKEPTVLPAKLPNLILNGASGIAVGMATNIPPHNLREVVDAICHLIDNPEATVEDLGKLVLGPDFPTGGIVMGLEGIKSAYATGRGRILVRAKAFIEDAKGERQNIIVTELPYQVNKAALQERIAELVKDGRIEGIGDMRDESDRHGMRVVMELKKGAEARTVLNLLFKYTAMQTTFGVNLLALVDGEPRVLTLKRILQHYIDYRHQVITRRVRFDLAKARAREHILEGLKIALDHLDEVISIIRQSPDADAAKTRLIKRFHFDDIQAQAILDMQLRRLARLEREKIEQELKEVRKNIAYLEDLLAHPKKIFGLIKDELLDLRERYGDDRRTRIIEQEAQEFKVEDLIPDEDMVVALTQKGYLKRYRPPRRSTKPVVSRETDPERDLCVANMHDGVLFVTDGGRVCQLRCHELPEADRSARGTPVGNLINLEPRESIVSMLALPRDPGKDTALAMVTRRGKVKRVAATEFATVRGAGVAGIQLDSDDRLAAARLVKPGQELVVTTRSGQVLRHAQDEVRVMGRQAGGVAGIRLSGADDAVAALDVAHSGAYLLGVTELGAAKRTEMAEFPLQGRGGGGVAFVKTNTKTGPVVAALVVATGDETALCTSEGQVWRGPVESIVIKGRGLTVEPLADLKLVKGETLSGCTISRPELDGRARSAEGRPRRPGGGAEDVVPHTGAARKPKVPASSGDAKIASGARKRAAASSAAVGEQVPPAEPTARGDAGPAGSHAPGPRAASGQGRRAARSVLEAAETPAASPTPAPAPEPKTAGRRARTPSAAQHSSGPPQPATVDKGTAVAPARRKSIAAPPEPAVAKVEPPPAGAAGRRVLPQPPPVAATTAEPRLSPKPPAAPARKGRRTLGGPAEQMALPMNGAPAPEPSVKAPERRAAKAPPEPGQPPVRVTKPAAPAEKPAARPPAVNKTTSKVRAVSDQPAPKAKPPAAGKASAKAKPSPEQPVPTVKPPAASKAGAKAKAAPKPEPQAAPRGPAGKKAASPGNLGGVMDKPCGPGDILIRTRGGRVGWLKRDE